MSVTITIDQLREAGSITEWARREARRAADCADAPAIVSDALHYWACVQFQSPIVGASHVWYGQGAQAHGRSEFDAALDLTRAAMVHAFGDDALLDLTHIALWDTQGRAAWRAGFDFARRLKARGLRLE